MIAYRGGRHELFKVDEDISEAHDLSAQNPEKVQELAGMLEDWMDRTITGDRSDLPGHNLIN